MTRGSSQRKSGWCRNTDSCTYGTDFARTSGIRVPRLLRPVHQLVLQLAGQPLSLAPGELEWRVLSPVAVPAPGQVVAAQHARVVLQLHQVQSPLADDQQVDLVPLALAVAELEVGPGAEGIELR